MKQIIVIFGLALLTPLFYRAQQMGAANVEMEAVGSVTMSQNVNDTIVISERHHPNFILCDLDGDNLSDTVRIVLNRKNEKYGLEIIFGNKQVKYLGLGMDVLGQGFDDMVWVGVFEKAPKGDVYFNNVNDEGEIIGEAEIEESDKIKLPNDGIFIHQAEASGGGVIYLNNGKFEWIQQD